MSLVCRLSDRLASLIFTSMAGRLLQSTDQLRLERWLQNHDKAPLSQRWIERRGYPPHALADVGFRLQNLLLWDRCFLNALPCFPEYLGVIQFGGTIRAASQCDNATALSTV